MLHLTNKEEHGNEKEKVIISRSSTFHSIRRDVTILLTRLMSSGTGRDAPRLMRHSVTSLLPGFPFQSSGMIRNRKQGEEIKQFGIESD